MSDDECIHLPRSRDEHDRKHMAHRDSCGWCCYLREQQETARLKELLRRVQRIAEKHAHG